MMSHQCDDNNNELGQMIHLSGGLFCSSVILLSSVTTLPVLHTQTQSICLFYFFTKHITDKENVLRPEMCVHSPGQKNTMMPTKQREKEMVDGVLIKRFMPKNFRNVMYAAWRRAWTTDHTCNGTQMGPCLSFPFCLCVLSDRGGFIAATMGLQLWKKTRGIILFRKMKNTILPNRKEESEPQNPNLLGECIQLKAVSTTLYMDG